MSEDLKKVAAETLKAIRNGVYSAPSGKQVRIEKAITNTLYGTKMYEPDYVPFKSDTFIVPKISVTNESTLEAGYRLRNKNPCVLNFASAKSPGGGFLRGCVAQEETIARASGLYYSLMLYQDFYKLNMNSDAFYLNYCIYSPNVIVFRNDECEWLEEPYLMSVLTSPAPRRAQIESQIYSSEIDMSLVQMHYRLESVIDSRISQILSVMAENGHRVIVLGAWGCGVFGNDPEMVAQAFRNALRFWPHFDEVVFSIYDDPESNTYKTFERYFQ